MDVKSTKFKPSYPRSSINLAILPIIAYEIKHWLTSNAGQTWENPMKQNEASNTRAAGVGPQDESLTRVPQQPTKKDIGDIFRSNDSYIPLQTSHSENIRGLNDTRPGAVQSSDPKLRLPKRRIPSAPMQHNERQNPSSATYLPFKLQHDLLTTIQVLIEEACFYFAQKWLPGVLESKGWNTPEQGELTSWWKILKNTSVPSQAISFRGREAQGIFLRCRQIRHNAVHRNPVSVLGIKQMIIDARDLVGGLNDELRNAKVRKLQNCLHVGDLDSLRISIDEPLGGFGIYRDPPLVGDARGHEGLIKQSGGGTNASEKSLQPCMNDWSAPQLGPTSTLPFTQAVDVLGTKSANVNSLPTFHDSKGPQATPSYTGPESISEQQAQTAKYQEYKAIMKTQPNLDGGVIQQGSNVAAGFNDVVSGKKQIVIDLTGDDIIDLTQDSGDENMAELGQAITFSGHLPANPCFVARRVRQVIEPGVRRERKSKARKRRKARKLLRAQ